MQKKITTHIVIGLRWGDEGKGKIVDMLASRFAESEDISKRFCVRFNGGPNAGHTIYHKGRKVVTHQVPSGILYGMPSVIGDNCYVDIDKLADEIVMLRDYGVDLGRTHQLYLSPRAHIITTEHTREDGAETRIGTTKSGIGPCASDKYKRTGFRVQDADCENLEVLGVTIQAPDEIFREFFTANGHHAPCLVEGAQAWGLDISHGFYPYVTSSHCLATDCMNMGINMHPRDNRGNEYEVRVWGIAKAYDTYVGALEFQPSDDTTLAKYQEIGQEFGATTGRPRQCNYLDLDGLLHAAFVNQCTDIVINKCDVLEEVGVFCTRSIRLNPEDHKKVHLGMPIMYRNILEFTDVIKSRVGELPNVRNVFFEFSASSASSSLTKVIL